MSRSGVVVGMVALTFAVAMACGESSGNPGSGAAAGAGGDGDSSSAGAPTGGSRAGGGAANGGVAGSIAGKGGSAEPSAGDGGDSARGGAGEGGSGAAGEGGSGGAGEGGSGGVAEPGPSGGAAGTEAGAGGAGPIATSCEAASPTVVPSCTAVNDPDGENACRECLKSRCCESWQACYGTGPRNACGYGEQVGDAIGEADCTILCWYQTYDGSESGEETLAACVEQCAACADTAISDVTNELVSCAYDECADACFPKDF